MSHITIKLRVFGLKKRFIILLGWEHLFNNFLQYLELSRFINNHDHKDEKDELFLLNT